MPVISGAEEEGGGGVERTDEDDGVSIDDISPRPTIFPNDDEPFDDIHNFNN